MRARLAPAKINLTLHVTGRRADGFHALDSLVVFTSFGDEVALLEGSPAGLTVSGTHAASVPSGEGNLIARAARLIGATDTALRLEKRLPAAAGMGGGSSDAAAALHLLAETRGLDVPDTAALMNLGSDLPVCMAAPAPCRMRGRGERIDPLGPLPEVGLLIVNPGVALSTPAVFAALAQRANPAMPETLPQWTGAEQFCGWLGEMRNDLEAPARQLVPEIGEVLTTLAAQPGCLLARMTGSGATCFGLFADDAALMEAERALAIPGRFVVATRILAPGTPLTMSS
jgi:4-diphosphocytidyl-2-C-methyl-D-erythritol kinase